MAAGKVGERRRRKKRRRPATFPVGARTTFSSSRGEFGAFVRPEFKTFVIKVFYPFLEGPSEGAPSSELRSKILRRIQKDPP